MGLSQSPAGAESVTGASADANSLRIERDRFVALAFCNADLLLELDDDGIIRFAAGAANVFLGVSAEELIGKPLRDYIAERHLRIADRLLRDAVNGRRIDNVLISLRGPKGPTLPLVLGGFHIADMAGHTYLALRVAPRAGVSDEEDAGRVAGSELYDSDTFSEAALEALKNAAASGQDVQLSMFELGKLQELSARLDDAAKSEMNETVGALFRASSVNGDTAGELDTGKYGLVHQHDLDVQALSQDIETYVKEIDPKGEGVSVTSATMEVDSENLSEGDMARAVVYAINQFCDESKDAFSLQDLSSNFAELTARTVERRNRFVDLISKGEFDFAFQPICDMQTQRPHHFEALVRLDKDAFGVSPFEFITFLEELDIICDFDLAMCQKVLDWLKQANKQGYKYMTAVNVSGRSLSNPEFVAKLKLLLSSASEVRDSLLFEVTESAKLQNLEEANKIIQELREAGHVVCLDDFGAGVAAFQYLSSLHVDVVKIDGTYVQEAAHNKRSKALLRAMASMCHDLGVTTVAEMIEDEKMAQLVRECGIKYGQGYLFGRPSKSITEFKSPRPVEFKDADGKAKAG